LPALFAHHVEIGTSTCCPDVTLTLTDAAVPVAGAA
jgi:hypothetical protein